MVRKLTNQSAVWLLIGLVVGVGLTFFMQGQPAQATATDHSDDFAIATGHLTIQLEAVYLLDFKSGQLLGSVMNRQAGEFQQSFRRDLSKDFALNPRQKPKFIMVTGDFESARAQVPVNHVLYVAELNSGRVGAYIMPYRGEQIRGTTTEELQLLHMVPFRQAAPLRQQ